MISSTELRETEGSRVAAITTKTEIIHSVKKEQIDFTYRIWPRILTPFSVASMHKGSPKSSQEKKKTFAAFQAVLPSLDY